MMSSQSPRQCSDGGRKQSDQPHLYKFFGQVRRRYKCKEIATDLLLCRLQEEDINKTRHLLSRTKATVNCSYKM